MPRKCSIYGCKSNYTTKNGPNEYVTTFAIPKNEPLRSEWLSKLPTDLQSLKNPAVCVKHFHDSCLSWVDKVVVKGEPKEYPRKIPKLSEGAFPTIFPSKPASPTIAPSTTTKLANREKENFETGIEEGLPSVRQREIKCLQDIDAFFSTDMSKIREEWSLLHIREDIVLCFMDLCSACPKILGSLRINAKLEPKIFIGSVEVNLSELKGIASTVSSVHALEKTMLYLEQNVETGTEDENIKIAITQLINSPDYLYMCSSELKFLVEQLRLYKQPPNKRKYCSNTMVLASSLYNHSPSAYRSLYKAGFFFIPHPRRLQKLICTIPNDHKYAKSQPKRKKFKKK